MREQFPRAGNQPEFSSGIHLGLRGASWGNRSWGQGTSQYSPLVHNSLRGASCGNRTTGNQVCYSLRGTSWGNRTLRQGTSQYSSQNLRYSLKTTWGFLRDSSWGQGTSICTRYLLFTGAFLGLGRQRQTGTSLTFPRNNLNRQVTHSFLSDYSVSWVRGHSNSFGSSQKQSSSQCSVRPQQL